MTVVELSDRRAPVCYTVHFCQYWDGRLQIRVEDVADDERSRKSIAAAMRQAADFLEGEQ
jgi:hypothetical protein